MWKDTSGRALTDYPRPSVAVDVAVLTFRAGRLAVVVVRSEDGRFALPGTFLHVGERLADAAARALREKAGLPVVDFRQLAVFDDPDRDERGWVLSVGHVAAVPADRLSPNALLIDLPGTEITAPLRFDHSTIVARAVAELRRQYGGEVDPNGLCGNEFTVLELRRLYEAVFGHRLPKDSFRRHVINDLVDTGHSSMDAVGRPAALFTRVPSAALSPAVRTFLESAGRQ